MNARTPQHGRVLDVAEELFFRYGYTRVTTEEIARASGISKKTLYALFPSKKAIVTEAFLRASRYVMDVRNSLPFDDARSFRTQLITFLRALAEANARFSAPLYDDLRAAEPRLHGRSHTWRRRYVQDTLVEILQRGQTLGVVRSDLDPKLAAAVLSSVMIHFVHPDLRSRDGYIPRPDTIICVLLHGVEARSDVAST